MLQRLVLICLLATFACAPNASNEVSKEVPRPDYDQISLRNQPNILWLVAEDLSEYLPAYGDSTVVTPNLDRLAAEGIVYDRFFTPAPVCAPARSALATGMYPSRIGTNHMRNGPWLWRDPSQAMIDRITKYFPEGVPAYEAMPPTGTKMMSEYLRGAGYYCTNNAKQDYQFRYSLGAWDESSGKAHWRNRKSPDQPFFSVFNFEVTHESQMWAKAEDSLWVADDLQVNVPPYLPDTEIGRQNIRRLYSNIKEMDQQIGEIIAQLEADGELENTVIMWYGDHGGPMPRQKRLLFDSGMKVPFIARFPNQQQAGTRDPQLLSFVDLAPTILSLANVEVPQHIEGKAFAGAQKKSEPAKYVFAAGDRFDAVSDRIRAARDQRYKLIRYYDQDLPMFLHVKYRDQMPLMQELHRLRAEDKLTPEQALWFRDTKPEIEFFDTEVDPHELNDLSGDPAYAEKIAELSAAMDDWIASTEDFAMIPETEYLEQIWPGGKQPITAEAKITKTEVGAIEITCETEGASLAYQLQDQADTTWYVYTEPLVLEPGQKIKVNSHRLGWRDRTVRPAW